MPRAKTNTGGSTRTKPRIMPSPNARVKRAGAKTGNAPASPPAKPASDNK